MAVTWALVFHKYSFFFFPQKIEFQDQMAKNAYNELTFSKTSPGFYVSAVQVLETLWEKEKLLIMSNFSFSHSVFYWFGEVSAIFIKFKIVSCKLCQSWSV